MIYINLSHQHHHSSKELDGWVDASVHDDPVQRPHSPDYIPSTLRDGQICTKSGFAPSVFRQATGKTQRKDSALEGASPPNLLGLGAADKM